MELKGSLLTIAAVLLTAAPSPAMNFKISHSAASSGRKLNVVHMSGAIDQGEFSRWKEAVAYLDRNNQTLFVIDSPGGSVSDGFFLLDKIAAFLREEKAAGRTTAILAAGKCASMCVPMFYMFDRRFAEETVQFGLHGMWFDNYGVATQETTLYLDRMNAIAGPRKDERTPKFLTRMREAGVFSTTESTRFSSQELLEASGIIPADGIVASESAALERLDSDR